MFVNNVIGNIGNIVNIVNIVNIGNIVINCNIGNIDNIENLLYTIFGIFKTILVGFSLVIGKGKPCPLLYSHSNIGTFHHWPLLI